MDSKFIIAAIERWLIEFDPGFIDVDVCIFKLSQNALLHMEQFVVRVRVKTSIPSDYYDDCLVDFKAFLKRILIPAGMYEIDLSILHTQRQISKDGKAGNGVYSGINPIHWGCRCAI